jgi:hypothetical protein
VDPVTYSLTIADYPAGIADFQVHFYLVPGADQPVSMSYPDYGVEDCVYIQIAGNGGGGGYMNFAYKVDAPNSNGVTGHDYWTADDGVNGGRITNVGSSTILGEWSVTFTTGTDFTLTAPDGTVANGSFTEATAAQFDGTMYVYAGIVPNSDARKGLSATISRIQLEGFPVPIDDSFTSPFLDPAWEVSAALPAAIVPIVAVESPLWISWTLPAPGYALQFSTALEGDWQPFSDAAAFNNLSSRYLLINRNSTPELSGGRAFFQLQKP